MKVDGKFVEWFAEALRRFPCQRCVVVQMHPRLWMKFQETANIVLIEGPDLSQSTDYATIGAHKLELKTNFPGNVIDVVDGNRVLVRFMLGA